MKKNFLPIFLIIASLFLTINSTLPAFAQVQRNLSVTATVPPITSDFQFNLTSDGQTNVPQGTTLSYTITYGAKTSAGVNTTTTLVADWSQDTAPDSSHVLDYVIGSASNGYGNTSPVVDLNSRTITWTIPSLPAGTIDQAVTFQLKTNSNYTGVSPVSFTTKAKMNNEYINMPDQTITQTYQFDESLVTPTPTLTPTSTLAPTSISTAPKIEPTSIPTPTSQPVATTPSFKITDVSFIGISNNNASISVSTNKSAIILVKYGTSPTSLSKTVSAKNYNLYHLINIEGLSPATNYYFQISATDKEGKIVQSEIFTFKTAISSPANQEKSIAVLTSNGTVVFSEIIDKKDPSFPLGILPNNYPYELTYKLKYPISAKLIEVLIKNPSGQTLQTIHMGEIDSKTFVARLKTFKPGMYTISSHIRDNKGNLIEQKIADLKVVYPLSVYDQDEQTPIGDARIKLFYYNHKIGQYEKVSSEIFGNIKNPAYTDKLGKLVTILPQGKYRVEASALFFEKTITDFTLGSDDNQTYPKIYLKKAPFNLFQLYNYLEDLWSDSFINLLAMTQPLSTSERLFNVFAAITTCAFIILGFLFFSFKTAIKFKHLPLFLIFNLKFLLKKHQQKYFFGTVINENNEKLNQVQISLINPANELVMTHIQTNKAGKFYFKNIFKLHGVTFLATKDGYVPLSVTLSNKTNFPDNGIVMKLQKDKSAQSPVITFTHWIEHYGGSLFEATLLISFITELVFLSIFGFYKALPFFVLSMVNVILWALFVKESE